MVTVMLLDLIVPVSGLFVQPLEGRLSVSDSRFGMGTPSKYEGGR